MWIECRVCGSLVADVTLHASWHAVPIAQVLGDQTPPPGVDPDGLVSGAPDGD